MKSQIKILMPVPLRDFYELYKYGSVRLDRQVCTVFDTYNKDGVPHIDETQFMKQMPFFDKEDQGIILECEIDKDDYESVDFCVSGIIRGHSLTMRQLNVNPVLQFLHIEDIVKIYPLTENALASLSVKIGDDIALEKPVFQNLFKQATEQWVESSREKGVRALFEMSGLDLPDEREIYNRYLDQAEKCKAAYQKPDRQERFLVHAMVYERREPFPKSDVGILYDLCKILADKEKTPNYRKTKFYEKLETLKSELYHAGIVEILQYFEGEPHYETVRNMATHADCQHKDYITAALFTKYKELLRDDKYKSLEMIKEIQKLFKIFPEETKAALYLIGALFSYERFHNDLYISKRLRILKESRVEPKPPTTPEDVTLGPPGVPESQSVPPAESKTSTLEIAENPPGEAAPGTTTEPVTLLKIPGEESLVISDQSNGAVEAVQPSRPTIENADNKNPLDGKMPISSETLPFEEIPVVAQPREILRKGKGRKPKGIKKQEDQDKQST